MAYLKPDEDMDEARRTLEAIADEHHAFSRRHIMEDKDGFHIPDEMADLYVEQMKQESGKDSDADGDTDTDEVPEKPKRPGRPRKQAPAAASEDTGDADEDSSEE